MNIVEEKRNQLRELEEKLENLQRRFSISCKEKEKLENEQKLYGLGGEHDRWEAAADEATEALARMPGDTLMAATSLAYLPPHPAAIRYELLPKWLQIVKEAGLEVTEPFETVTTLTKPLDLRQWGLQGLPQDSFSQENATIVKNTSRWPFMIDPDSQGTTWLQQNEAANGIEVLRAEESLMLSPGSLTTPLEKALSRCVPLGRPLLLHDLQGDPPILLYNILNRITTLEGPSQVRVVVVGDMTLEYHPNFRLFLSSKQPEPELSLEVQATVTIVNFTVTLEGLHDNLRQILVKKEKPELEDERQKQVITTSNHQNALHETEERILQTLSTAQGNILESEEAIKILEDTKQINNEDSKNKADQVNKTSAAPECVGNDKQGCIPARKFYIKKLTDLLICRSYCMRTYYDLYTIIYGAGWNQTLLTRRLPQYHSSLVVGTGNGASRSLRSGRKLKKADKTTRSDSFDDVIALILRDLASITGSSIDCTFYKINLMCPLRVTPTVEWCPPGQCPCWKLFAYDSKLFKRIQSDGDRDTLQEDLQKLHEWSTKWLLQFNESKCKLQLKPILWLVPQMRGLSYEVRLERLGLTSLEKRRFRG
ncbi:unnamed protein product, partial [Meganyctiphanes norvegica]